MMETRKGKAPKGRKRPDYPSLVTEESLGLTTKKGDSWAKSFYNEVVETLILNSAYADSMERKDIKLMGKHKNQRSDEVTRGIRELTKVTQEMVDEVVTMKQQIEDAFASRNFPATGNCSGCEYKHCCTKRH